MKWGHKEKRMNIKDYSLGQERRGSGGLPSTCQAHRGAKEAERGDGDHPGVQIAHLWDRGILSAAGRPGPDYSQSRAHEAPPRLPGEIECELVSCCFQLQCSHSPVTSPSPHHHPPTTDTHIHTHTQRTVPHLPILDHPIHTERRGFHKVSQIMFCACSKPSSSFTLIWEQNTTSLS